MRPFDDDSYDLDEFEFDNPIANRRPHRAKRHHRSSGHKRHRVALSDPWEVDDWDDTDSYDDYDPLEFDDYSGINTRY